MELMQKKKNRRDNIMMIFFIILLGLYQLFRCLYEPGIYMDSANPDFLAVQLLFPEVQNSKRVLNYSVLPLLGQVYHGTITIWLQMLLILLIGEASVLTLRLANMIYVVGICWLLYLIMKKQHIKKYYQFTFIALIMLSPQIFSFVRSQYYIKLPGTFCLLCAIYFVLFVGNKEKKVLFIVLSGVFNGIAFYSYFNYFFFMPALLSYTIYRAKREKTNGIRDGLVWLTGFCYGAVPYVIGYLDYIVSSTAMNVELKRNIVLITGVSLVVLGLLFLIWLIRYFENVRLIYKAYCVIAIFIFIGVIALLNYFPFIHSILSPKFGNLNLMEKEMSILERIEEVFFLWGGVMRNIFCESLMVGLQKSIWDYFDIVILIGVSIITAFLLYHRTLTEELKSKIAFLLFIVANMLSFAVCSIILISRMGGQHFVPIYFLSMLTILIEIDIVTTLLKKKYIVGILQVLLVSMIIVGAVKTEDLSVQLKSSGGKTWFTSQINELAEIALEEKEKGEKEVYIFPEWGLFCGFNYLTMNQVRILESINETEIDNYLNEGYSFIVCFWEKDNADKYLEQLNNVGLENFGLTAMYTGKGEEVLYILSKESFPLSVESFD